MSLPENIPEDLSTLLDRMVSDFSGLLYENLVGMYLWGSLTYEAFDETCSDVDCIVVTRRDLGDREFGGLDDWFRNAASGNRWVKRVDMRFVIDGEFLDKTSRCCGFYPYTGKMVRQGSDGNPIIWINIAKSGVTLWGRDAKLIAPRVSNQCLNDALLLELNYLKADLASNAGDRSDKAFTHNAYAVLTACRILYSSEYQTVVSKDQAYAWAMKALPSSWSPIIQGANENRLKNHGSTTPELEEAARRFIAFVTAEVSQKLGQANSP